MLRHIFVPMALTLLPLGGCSTVFNSEIHATTAAERHPITVDQQTVSMSVDVDPTLAGLSRDTLAALDDFLTEYRTRGHGPVTVTAPSGSSRDIDGQQTAAEVRQALNGFGLQYEDMRGATYRAADANGPVLVSFSSYVASAPVCGVFTGEQMARLKNLPAPNFGCATQANFAAMVADPRDLTAAQALAPSNGTQAAAAVRAARTGQDTWTDDRAVGVSLDQGAGQ